MCVWRRTTRWTSALLQLARTSCSPYLRRIGRISCTKVLEDHFEQFGKGDINKIPAGATGLMNSKKKEAFGRPHPRRRLKIALQLPRHSYQTRKPWNSRGVIVRTRESSHNHTCCKERMNVEKNEVMVLRNRKFMKMETKTRCGDIGGGKDCKQ